MKKLSVIVSVLLAVVLAFGLVGCSSYGTLKKAFEKEYIPIFTYSYTPICLFTYTLKQLPPTNSRKRELFGIPSAGIGRK